MVKQDHMGHDPEPSKAIRCPYSKCAPKPPRLGLLSQGGSWWVWCKSCGCAGPTANGELEAVMLWNERYQEPVASKPPSTGRKLALVLFALLSMIFGFGGGR